MKKYCFHQKLFAFQLDSNFPQGHFNFLMLANVYRVVVKAEASLQLRALDLIVIVEIELVFWISKCHPLSSTSFELLVKPY